MEPTRSLEQLTDGELLLRLADILRQSRRNEADLVAHIGEVDARRLYAREASPCRVGPGGRPPGPPTDPDVRISRIRLVRSRICCARLERAADAWLQQRVALQQTIEALPRHASLVGAAIQPLLPDSPQLVAETDQGYVVALNAVVGVVPA